MYLIAYILWIAAAAMLAWQVAHRLPMRPLRREIIGWGLAIVLILLPYWDVILGAPTFNRICRNDGGVVVHEAIDFPLSSLSIDEHEAGRCYYCLVLLVMGAATETQADIRSGSDPLALTTRLGPVSYQLADASNAACAAFDAAYAPPRRRSDLWTRAGKQDDGQTCVVGARITEISADYELTGPQRSEERHGIVVLEARRVELRRRGAAVALATLTSYRQLPWNGRIVSMQAALPPVRSCPAFENSTTSDSFTVVTLMEKLMQQKDERSTQ